MLFLRSVWVCICHARNALGLFDSDTHLDLLFGIFKTQSLYERKKEETLGESIVLIATKASLQITVKNPQT